MSEPFVLFQQMLKYTLLIEKKKNEKEAPYPWNHEEYPDTC